MAASSPDEARHSLDATTETLVYLYEMTNRRSLQCGRGWRRSAAGALIAVATVALLMGISCGEGDTPDDSSTPSFGPVGTITTGGRLAFIGREGNLSLINADGSGVETITQSGGVQRYLWSPDGSLIALQRQEGAGTVVDVIEPGGDVIFTAAGGSAPVWSPQGDGLLVERDGGIDLLDAAGQVVRSLPFAILPDWSRDGRAIAFIRTLEGGKGVPMIVTVESGEERELDPAIKPDDAIYPVLWHPGGAALAFRNTLYEIVAGMKTDLAGPVAGFSPDGRLVLVVLGPDPDIAGRPAELLDLTRRGEKIIGLEVRPAPDETPPWQYIKRWIGWSKDGRLLVYMDPDELRPRARIYDTVAIQQEAYSNIRGENPDVSPDGTLAAFEHDGRVWVFPLNATALVPVAEGSLPAWQPGG